MAKYKLIKIYPKSPPLGTIVEVGNDGYLTYRMRNDYNQEMTSIHKSVLTEYSEFWEEVVEKDYKILSLSLAGPYNHRISNVSNDSDKYICGLLACKGNYIHSVKRLSDGEIFTVGDKIESYNTTKTIKRIELPESNPNDIGFITKSTSYPGTGYQYLIKDNVKKVKQPLFTTEDGVNIYVGDYISTVLLDTMEIFTDCGLVGRDTRPVEGFKYFSTKEKAEEYILMNKPCLSVADICTYFDGQLSECLNLFYLKKLAKSKLNESKD